MSSHSWTWKDTSCSMGKERFFILLLLIVKPSLGKVSCDLIFKARWFECSFNLSYVGMFWPMTLYNIFSCVTMETEFDCSFDCFFWRQFSWIPRFLSKQKWGNYHSLMSASFCCRLLKVNMLNVIFLVSVTVICECIIVGWYLQAVKMEWISIQIAH